MTRKLSTSMIWVVLILCPPLAVVVGVTWLAYWVHRHCPMCQGSGWEKPLPVRPDGQAKRPDTARWDEAAGIESSSPRDADSVAEPTRPRFFKLTRSPRQPEETAASVH